MRKLKHSVYFGLKQEYPVFFILIQEDKYFCFNSSKKKKKRKKESTSPVEAKLEKRGLKRGFKKIKTLMMNDKRKKKNFFLFIKINQFQLIIQ